MEYLSELGYIGLFIAAFLAATILPLSSEVVLGALLLSGLPPTALVLVATTGNVLGALTNYAIGYWLGQGVIQKWLKIPIAQYTAAKNRFQKYGLISLCFAWVPIIGDPLTVVAGVLRVSIPWFVVLVTMGKLLRYVVISYLVLQNM